MILIWPTTSTRLFVGALYVRLFRFFRFFALAALTFSISLARSAAGTPAHRVRPPLPAAA